MWAHILEAFRMGQQLDQQKFHWLSSSQLYFGAGVHNSSSVKLLHEANSKPLVIPSMKKSTNGWSDSSRFQLLMINDEEIAIAAGGTKATSGNPSRWDF